MCMKDEERGTQVSSSVYPLRVSRISPAIGFTPCPVLAYLSPFCLFPKRTNHSRPSGVAHIVLLSNQSRGPTANHGTSEGRSHWVTISHGDRHHEGQSIRPIDCRGLEEKQCPQFHTFPVALRAILVLPIAISDPDNFHWLANNSAC